MMSISVYLPIRSFGDFIITTSILKINSISNIPIILPDYFVDLFNAIKGYEFYDISGRINLSNQPALFELYKVKNINNLQRLLAGSATLYKNLTPDKNYLLDFRSRRMMFTRGKLTWPQTDKNIYLAKSEMLQKQYSLNPLITFPPISKKLASSIKNIVIFPESRIKDKEINENLIAQILEIYGTKITVAKFSNQTTTLGAKIYSNFNELSTIITNADLIISAESLPYHLANFYSVPHFVIYKKTKHFNENFMTGFMIDNKSYSTINGADYSNILLDLSVFLS